MLQEPPPIVLYPTSEGAKRLLAVSPQYLRDVIVLALGTGMRKSEIFTLTRENITINEIFRWGKITVIGKGNKLRTIRMNKTVYNLLIRKSNEKDSSYAFPSKKTGKHLTDFKHSFTSALRQAGIDNSRFHDLRHTAASWMVQGGASLYAVRKILGHSCIRTTQRYAHLSPGYPESEIGKIDDFLSPENEAKKELAESVSESVV